MKQPAERETTLSTTPLCSLTSQAHLLMDQRDSWDKFYKAHLTKDMTVSLKRIRFNHQQSLLAPTERWICLANCAPVTLRFFVVCMCEHILCVFSPCVQTWSSCHSLAVCCRNCWDYLSRTGSGSLHNSALLSRILLHPPHLQHHQSKKTWV